MTRKILVPDYLPNNLEIIRTIEGMTIGEMAKDLEIDRNFLASVEKWRANFSGKTTIRYMKYMNVNFYQIYDIKKKVVCSTTDYFPIKIQKEIVMDRENIKDINKIKKIDVKKCIRKELIKEGFKGKIKDFEIIKITPTDEKIIVLVNIDFDKFETKNVEFDINFAKNENRELYKMLKFKGFKDIVTDVEEYIDNENIKVEGNNIILPYSVKLPLNNNANEFIMTNKLTIDGENVKIIENDKKQPVIVKFKAIRKEISNLRIIRALTNKSAKEMYEALGMSYNGYTNLELGNQKISSKIMWLLVKLTGLPLEVIINIDEYYYKYCSHSKIKKPRNIFVLEFKKEDGLEEVSITADKIMDKLEEQLDEENRKLLKGFNVLDREEDDEKVIIRVNAKLEER